MSRLTSEFRPSVRVGVLGRAACGRRTVTRALGGAGVVLAGPSEPPDVDLYVFAETLKPEDRCALAESPRPVVAVLNKADLAGFGGQGPLAAAGAHCRALSALIGIWVHPLAGLAAAAALDGTVDDELLDALATLTTDPADLASTDRFAAQAHPLPAPVRARLLAELDLFGIAHGVLALRAGADRPGLLAALRRASAVDGVLAAIEVAAAPVRYERLVDAQLFPDDDGVAARMAAAIEVVRAAGMAVDTEVTASAHLRRAIRWQRYSRGPVSQLHRSCGADIARGSLRLWERAQ